MLGLLSAKAILLNILTVKTLRRYLTGRRRMYSSELPTPQSLAISPSIRTVTTITMQMLGATNHAQRVQGSMNESALPLVAR